MTAVVDSISRTFTSNGQPKAEEVVAVGLTVAEAVASLVTLLPLVFFWMTEHARLQRYALAFVSLDRRAGMRAGLGRGRGPAWAVGPRSADPDGVDGARDRRRSTPCSAFRRRCSSGLIAGFAEAIPLVGPLIGVIPALLVAATVDPQLSSWSGSRTSSSSSSRATSSSRW